MDSVIGGKQAFVSNCTVRKKLSLPRTTSAIKIDNDVVSLLWRIQCQQNTVHDKFLSLSDKLRAVLAVVFLYRC